MLSPRLKGVSLKVRVPAWSQVHLNQVELFSGLEALPVWKQGASLNSVLSFPGPVKLPTAKGDLSQRTAPVGQSASKLAGGL